MITITAEQARANADAAKRPIEQFYRDLDNSIQIGSENGRRYIVFGFSQVMASEQLVEDVTAQLLKNGFGVERLLSDSEQHYIRISWDLPQPAPPQRRLRVNAVPSTPRSQPLPVPDRASEMSPLVITCALLDFIAPACAPTDA